MTEYIVFVQLHMVYLFTHHLRYRFIDVLFRVDNTVGPSGVYLRSSLMRLNPYISMFLLRM